jgi:hypothetical protein
VHTIGGGRVSIPPLRLPQKNSNLKIKVVTVRKAALKTMDARAQVSNDYESSPDIVKAHILMKP